MRGRTKNTLMSPSGAWTVVGSLTFPFKDSNENMMAIQSKAAMYFLEAKVYSDLIILTKRGPPSVRDFITPSMSMTLDGVLKLIPVVAKSMNKKLMSL